MLRADTMHHGNESGWSGRTENYIYETLYRRRHREILCPDAVSYILSRSKFPENEAAGPETDVVSLKLETGAEFYKAYADIYSGGRHSSAAAFEPRGGIDTDERVKKRAVGKAVYEAGAELFAARPEWGILTGVRPAKLADELMSKAARALNRECGDFGVRSSCSETGVFPEYLDVRNAVEEILVRDYCTSAEKARLLTDVAKMKNHLYSRLKKIRAVFTFQFRFVLRGVRTVLLFHIQRKSFLL